MLGKGAQCGYMNSGEVAAILEEGLAKIPFDGRRVLVIIPDRTRTMPMPLFFRSIAKSLLPRTKALNFLIALGTHMPIEEEGILEMVGLTAEEKASGFPHHWFFQPCLGRPECPGKIGDHPEKGNDRTHRRSYASGRAGQPQQNDPGP